MQKKTLLLAVNLCRFTFSIICSSGMYFSFAAVRPFLLRCFACSFLFTSSNPFIRSLFPSSRPISSTRCAASSIRLCATFSIYFSDAVWCAHTCISIRESRNLCFVVKIKYMVTNNKHEPEIQQTWLSLYCSVYNTYWSHNNRPGSTSGRCWLWSVCVCFFLQFFVRVGLHNSWAICKCWFDMI